MGNHTKYKLNASLLKGLDLLRELNTVGRATPGELAARCGIDRTTTYRILETLIAAGYALRSPSDGHYVLAPRVRELSDGLTEYDLTSRVVIEELAALMPQVRWPSDLAVFDRGWMEIRESTHRLSPYSVHRKMIGKRRSLINSALGMSAICGASEEDAQRMLNMAYENNAIEEDRRVVEERIARARAYFEERGFAWSIGGSDTRISAIAVPVATGTGIPAAINVIFFTSALTIEQAAKRFLGSLLKCRARIEQRLKEGIDVAATD